MSESNILSTKQMKMMNQIKICGHGSQDSVIDFVIPFMKWHGSSKIPRILSKTKNCGSLNYEDYLNNCKVNTAQKLKSLFNLDIFLDAMEEISNNEIMLYRLQLDETLQNGLHALIQIQFLDSLVIIRSKECVEILNFSLKTLENIKFLMDNLIEFHSLNPPTVANEIYEDEKVKATNRFKNEFSYMSPERKNETKMNIKLQTLAFELTQQHECQIQRNSEILDAQCHSKYSENHHTT